MNRKIVAICLSLVLSFGIISGCRAGTDGASKVTPLPVATANPAITHPEGQFYESEGKLKAEGGLKVLGSDFMRVMINGKEEEFALTEHAQWEVSQYNKDPKNPRLCQGTMLLITYTQRNLVRHAETMDIIEAN